MQFLLRAQPLAGSPRQAEGGSGVNAAGGGWIRQAAGGKRFGFNDGQGHARANRGEAAEKADEKGREIAPMDATNDATQTGTRVARARMFCSSNLRRANLKSKT